MGRRKGSYYLSLLAGAVLLALSILGFVGLLGRPAIPWDELALTTGVPAKLLPEAIVRADGLEVRDTEFDFKFVTAVRRIGDEVEFVVREDGRDETVRARLVPFFSVGTFPAAYLLTGIFGFIVGFAVLILRPGDERARICFWLCVAFSSAVTISGDHYGVQGRALFVIPGIIFIMGYALTPAILLRFVMTLSHRRRPAWLPALWAVSLLFGGFFSAVIASSVLWRSAEIFRLKRYFFVFRISFVLICAVSLVSLYRSFRASPSREKRAQIKWVFFGLIVGLGPFMFLYQLPMGLGLRVPLGEEISTTFFALLPVALAIAILKHKLMDINVIINRSLVYSLLTMATVGIYLLSIELLRGVFSAGARNGRGWTPVGAAVIAAAAFAPVRNRIQLLVDKAFFRRGADYRRAVREFSAASASAFGPADLLRRFENVLADTLPVEKAGALILEPGQGMSRVAFRSGLDDGAVASLLARREGPGGSPAEARPEVPGFAAAAPVSGAADVPWGWVFVGRKKSGQEFTDEDRDLLDTLAAEMAAALGRIRLQEEVAYERASREKSEELSRLKTEFISSVSHELRTPMTSLQGISELLQSGKVADEARRNRLLELMAAECGRLGRFLHNVLDFGRIEQDAKRYDIRETDLKPVVAGVADIVRSAMQGEDLDLQVEMPEGPVEVEADPDAVRQALLNLIDNAVKYSEGRKSVAVRLTGSAGGAEVGVSDRGIGVAPEDRERIFEAFFRAPAAVRQNPKGVGLGLKIVKHIMDAHGGTIDIVGRPGRGTTFVLKFPKRRNP
jgi:signal transduction histidine kinase